MYTRNQVKKVNVGTLEIGGNNKIIIQSMTNTKTKNIKATVNQILALEKVGCELVRVAILDVEDAQAIKEIKDNINIPIVADIHFDYKLALLAIKRLVAMSLRLVYCSNTKMLLPLFLIFNMPWPICSAVESVCAAACSQVSV